MAINNEHKGNVHGVRQPVKKNSGSKPQGTGK